MFHCPHCHHLIQNGTRFCPYCGNPINYNRPNYNYRSQPPKQHHYGIATLVIIILIAIGFGGYYFYGGNSSLHHETKQAVSNVNPHKHSTNHQDKPSSSKQRPRKVVTQKSNVTSNDHQGSHAKAKSTASKDVTKPGYTMATIPSNLRGTWYSYDEGHLDTLVITAHSITDNGNTVTIHSRSKKADPNKIANHPTWGIATPAHVRGLNYAEIRGWNQGAGDGDSYAEFVRKGTVTLNSAGGADFWTDANFYKTKPLAKLFKKKIFKDHGELSQ